MKKIRALYRLFFLVICSVWAIGRMLLFARFQSNPKSFATKVRSDWSRFLLPGLGVKVHFSGHIPDYPCIIMGNHRSYLDPVALLTLLEASPVSKAEMSSWPLIGYGARLSGVVFLKRESPTSRKRTLVAIANVVRDGEKVILFPEGTTHAKPQCIPFRKGGFQLATEHNIPIVPMAIEYQSAADYWIDDDTFLGHFFRRFGEKYMHVYLRLGDPIVLPVTKDLMEATSDWINEQLLSLAAEIKKQR